MARPPEFDRPQVLQAALHVFWRDGYESASIQKLLDAMALNRGSLYSAFGDKEGLFLEVLDCYIDYQSENLELNLMGKDDPIVAIRSFLEGFALHEDSEMRERGCLVFNTIAELSHTRPHLAKEARTKVIFLRGLFVNRLEQAYKLGLIRADKQVDELADYLMALAVGLRTHCKMQTNPGVIREVIDIGLGTLTPSADKQLVPLL